MNVHELRDLAAVITANVHGEDDSRQNLVNFPSGAKMEAGPCRDLDTTIQVAIAGIHHSNEGPLPPKIQLHRVPAGLTTNEQILAWIDTLPGIAIRLTTTAAA